MEYKSYGDEQQEEEQDTEYGQEQHDPFFLRERFQRLNRSIENLQNPQNLEFIMYNIENIQNITYEDQVTVVPDLAF